MPKIKVSGNIVRELSQKIPSNIIALNELIKNAYDAGASYVEINIDSNNKVLSIKDDGCGMNRNDIDKLLHISNSEKKFGEINSYDRYTQGSKGLGFLSVFKFGNSVTWKTKKDESIEFSIEHDALVDLEDITEYNVNIKENCNIKKGTIIEINIYEDKLDYLKDYFDNIGNYEKVVNAFLDTSFKINLFIDGKQYFSNVIEKLIDYKPELQLYNVRFNSNDEKVYYYYKNIKLFELPFEFKSDSYKLDINVMIYSLRSGGVKKFTELFWDNNGDLTPLLYINNNLFNNYSLFYAGINRRKQSTQSLPQMIGYIKLYCDDQRMGFNSDRTHFLQNDLTDGIKKYLESINIFIQTNGGLQKKYLQKKNFLKCESVKKSETSEDNLRSYITDDCLFRDIIEIEITDNDVTYSIADISKTIPIIEDNKNSSDYRGHGNNSSNDTGSNTNGNDGSNNNSDSSRPSSEDTTNDGNDDSSNSNSNRNNDTQPAFIELKYRSKRIDIPSTRQIDLYNIIREAKDSSGNNIENSKIEIKINGSKANSNILECIDNECVKQIIYTYNDETTGTVIAKCILKFIQPYAKINNNSETEHLFELPTKKSYSIGYSRLVGDLVDQIESLNINEYKELIACSLRAIFEISVDVINKSEKHENMFEGMKQLIPKVKHVINYIKTDNKKKGYIKESSLIDFDSLSNILNEDTFGGIVEKCHLGAHKSMTYITVEEIKDIAKKAALFMVISNEIINNDNII